MQQEEQQFLSELGNYLYTSADKLLSTLDTSQCKHSVGYMRDTVTSPYSN